MSRAEEIYPLKRSVANQLESARKDRFNANVLERYYNARVAEGISLARIHKCLCTMRMLSGLLGMPFEKAEKDDIVRLVAKVERKGLADWTKRDYRVILKQFYKWLRNWEDGTPPEVRWIKKTTKAENKRPILPKHLLTPEEKAALVEAAVNPRDRALLEVFLESGRRLSEILTLHIGDIEFDQMGARLSIHGKKGSDFARIISSAPSLRLWLDFHPLRENPDAPVWIGIGNRNVNGQMAYSAAAAALKKIAKRAGIKKRIFYYLLRHTRIDETQGILTESQQCMMFGWQFGSRMPAVYMKRYGKHIDNAQAVMNGVANTQTKPAELQKPVACARCNLENSPYSDSCQRCGMSLKVKFGVQFEDRKKNAEELLYDILNDSEKLEKLRRFLAESHSK